MRFIQTFQLYDFFDTLVSLLVAFVFGTLIGAERQYRQRSAGLRTNVLVAVGASAFVDLANHLAGADGSVRVIAYVVSGTVFFWCRRHHEGRHERSRSQYGGNPVGFSGSGVLRGRRYGGAIRRANSIRHGGKYVIASAGKRHQSHTAQ
jgi:hypothetical protein